VSGLVGVGGYKITKDLWKNWERRGDFLKLRLVFFHFLPFFLFLG
jgi:hypothetical protein